MQLTIYLDLNHNTEFDIGEPSMEVESNSYFYFRDIYPGTYLLREVVPECVVNRMAVPQIEEPVKKDDDDENNTADLPQTVYKTVLEVSRRGVIAQSDNL